MGNFQAEIEAHVDVGMSPMEAIVSATGDSARSCWIDDTVGTLAEGKAADVLVVDGDPSTDIKGPQERPPTSSWPASAWTAGNYV